jgi:hypothetical protein
MKRFLGTTALAVMMASSAMANTTSAALMDFDASVAEHLYASELIGMRVYATETDVDMTVNASPEIRVEWDDIGEINELIVTPAGQVAAVIVGVGGFLGIGEKDVAVDMRQIKITREADDADDFFLVIKASQAELENAMFYERDVDAMASATDTQTASADAPLMTPPMVERTGFVHAQREELTAEVLTGARVYGANDEDVGEISKLILTQDGKIEQVLIDVGGFLGLGEKPVAVSFDELTVLREEAGGGFHIFIDASQEALEAKMAYEG